jgi:heme a synthase
MIHRYLAGALGLVVLALFVMAWKYKHQIKVSPWLTTALLAIISFQAMLGMWTVTMLLKPAVVSSHLLGGMTTLGLLVWISHRQWGTYASTWVQSNKMRTLIRFSLVIIFMQIFLGGWTSTNYAALACTDFPTCHGVWMPDMDFKDAFHMVRDLGQSANGGNLSLASLTAIQWTHRIGATITLIYLGFLVFNGLKYAQFKRISIALGIALVLQIILGIANLKFYLPIVLAVSHNFVAALLVVILVIFNSKITGKSTG